MATLVAMRRLLVLMASVVAEKPCWSHGKMDPIRAPINLNHSTLCPPCSICFLVLTPPPPPQLVENLPAMLETWVRFLGREDPLEKEMATHSSVLAWRIP